MDVTDSPGLISSAGNVWCVERIYSTSRNPSAQEPTEKDLKGKVRLKKHVEGERSSPLRATFKTRKKRAVNKGLVYCFIIRSVGTLKIALPKQAEGSWTGPFTWWGVSAATSDSIIFLL